MTLDELIKAIQEIAPNAIVHEPEYEGDEIYVGLGLTEYEPGGELVSVGNPQTSTDKTTLHYFAEDGNYGDANGLVVLDTTNWTELEWESVEESHESTRTASALIIDKARRKAK